MPRSTRTALSFALSAFAAIVVFAPSSALAAPGTYALSNLEIKPPSCVKIIEREEGALLFANNCRSSFTVRPVPDACAGCDPEIVLEAGEIGWYGLASSLPGDEDTVDGPRQATWQQGARRGQVSAQVTFVPRVLAAGGCQISPGLPLGGGAFAALALAGVIGIRRRRRLIAAKDA